MGNIVRLMIAFLALGWWNVAASQPTDQQISEFVDDICGEIRKDSVSFTATLQARVLGFLGIEVSGHRGDLAIDRVPNITHMRDCREEIAKAMIASRDELQKRQSNPPSFSFSRCRIVTAAKKSGIGTWGKGSIALCNDDEIAIGGTCMTDTSECGSNSRFIVARDGSSKGRECIVAWGGNCKSQTTAQVQCCK